MDKVFNGMCGDCRAIMLEGLMLRQRTEAEEALFDKLNSVVPGMSDGCRYASLEDNYGKDK